MSAMGKFEFSMADVDEINGGIDRLQNALEECTAKGPSLSNQSRVKPKRRLAR
jgi:hypothetical protein